MSSPSVTVIGLDAATLTVVRPLIAAGQLPNLAKLIAEGASGSLRSTLHPLTPHAWSTLVTGVNAGRHGIWDFAERGEDGYQLRLVNGSYRRAPALWDRLPHRCFGLVNIPFTWPAPSVDGFSVAGFDAADRARGMTAPAELIDELTDRFGPLELDNRFPLDRDGRLDLDRVRRGAEQKVDMSLWLADRFQPELLFVVFMAADHVQHLGWRDWERDGPASAVAEVYRILDAATGRLLEAAGDGNVLVVSDHGAGPLDGVVNLNAWLARQGYLTYLGGRAGVGRKIVDLAFGWRHHVSPGLRSVVKRNLPGLRERAYDRREYQAVDWPRTRAFAYGTFGSIVLNVRGRESEGVVEPGAEYERLRAELATQLMGLRGPADKPIVAAVHRREDLFYGPAVERLPDLVVEFHDYAWLGKGNLKSRSTSLWDRVEIEEHSSLDYVGTHRRPGLIAIAGPAAVPGVEIDASIEDVAPTLFYLLEEAVPADLEGRVLVEALDPGLLEQRPPEYDDSAAPEALHQPTVSTGTEVEERLRALGYVE